MIAIANENKTINQEITTSAIILTFQAHKLLQEYGKDTLLEDLRPHLDNLEAERINFNTYFTAEIKTQIGIGIFKGALSSLSLSVQKTHSDNDYRILFKLTYGATHPLYPTLKGNTVHVYSDFQKALQAFEHSTQIVSTLQAI